MIELLAPAKDKLCAKAAIDYGADAVYIGASEFGARKNVPNSLSDIKEVTEYAHKFKVKVYVALNTILNDEELINAKELVKKLSEINVDAIIIQDMGLLKLINESVEICAHASTQCDNRNPEKVKFLENAGFSRVILARELSIQQIKEIKKQTNIELEVFIHGALCVSYSGQCYLSYAIGGRSANRGECAQPCRKKYSLVDEEGNFISKDKHLLCLKDFNASGYLKELADAGVTSFKIEGRLKDVNYVKNVVAYYRKLIDELGLKKPSSGRIIFDFEPDLNKSFNRGFTDYFINGRQKEIYSFDNSKSIGEFLGKVQKVGNDYFEMDSNIGIYPQDGLCFFKEEELSGCLVNKIIGRKIYPNKKDGIIKGLEIYRNFDAEFDKKLKNSKTCRKISASIDFELGKIKATDEDGYSTEIKYDFEEFAQNEEKMRLNIINQLKKSGESDFLIEKINILTNKLPFLPVFKLNELRRDLLNKLMITRTSSVDEKKILKIKDEHVQFPQKEIDYKGNVLNIEAKEFYEKHGCKVTELALESGINCNNKIVMTTKHCLKSALSMCKSTRMLYLIDEKGKKYELKFNCDKCEMEIVF